MKLICKSRNDVYFISWNPCESIRLSFNSTSFVLALISVTCCFTSWDSVDHFNGKTDCEQAANMEEFSKREIKICLVVNNQMAAVIRELQYAPFAESFHCMQCHGCKAI